MSDPPPLLTGRGGAGNYHQASPSTNNSNKTSAPPPTPANELKYIHHGRGGAGNLSTTSQQIKPVESIVGDKIVTDQNKIISGGRGGAGNFRSGSIDEQREIDIEAGTKADRQGSVQELEPEQEKLQEPALAHLGEGREVVHES